MRIFRHYEGLPPELKGGAVAVGNFDGVHLGHRAVIGEAGLIARAGDPSVPWGVLTFEPHPRLLFKPDQEPFRLSPFRIKSRHIEEMGVDFMVVLHFDMALAKHPAESFVDEIVVGALGASHVIAGYDFQFGAKRRGNCQMLLAMGQEHGYGFTCVPAVTDDGGEPYSSTRVRDYLQSGDPRGAAAVLGRPFEIEGRVEHGDKRGRTIGFPTANVHLGEYIHPSFGVYAVRAGVDQGGETHWIDGVANLGMRPTYETQGVTLEVHLFDFDEDLYGKHLRVALIEHLRPERKFNGLTELQTQIGKDSAQAREILAQ
ncbi:bifunctional riboflavin kinase/FAD synthetase [Magnetospira sp. QH-2]|uniref:bifunctional riboflavin kinase/FAD synthetase n=1 Tax=Magnetospira sp. (strain QH-2) TaxID=1288970 RepID=UPI0003E810B5|nr:bifunctional riboflavin kinase/FAD synthetase [Magnetospira sp. QH-2]CCQ72297.1 bifunctional protein riboflavin kinase:FAD synthetase [Magnetospira sp. QH-2]